MLRPNKIVHGRYRIQQQLSQQGGMGTVFLAEDQVSRQDVALKYIGPRDEASPESVPHEAEVLKGLPPHPALPRVWDAFSDDDGQFLVMEYISGDDLDQRLRGRDTPFSVKEVLRWAGQLLAAL